MIFTMKYVYHSDYVTSFQKTIALLHLIHGTCQRGCPWQNGIIERSHRTDNEALLKVTRFTSSEERRYQLRLWEMYYNHCRPHQGLKGQIPLDVVKKEYPLFSAYRMLI